MELDLGAFCDKAIAEIHSAAKKDEVGVRFVCDFVYKNLELSVGAFPARSSPESICRGVKRALEIVASRGVAETSEIYLEGEDENNFIVPVALGWATLTSVPGKVNAYSLNLTKEGVAIVKRYEAARALRGLYN